MKRHGKPSQPQDLHDHNCIRYRTPWDGAIQPWIFSKGRNKPIEVAVEGSLIVNDIDLVLSAALDGIGMAYLPEPLIGPSLAQGALVMLHEDWSGTLPGVFLYYPSRRQLPTALRAFVDFVKVDAARQS